MKNLFRALALASTIAIAATAYTFTSASTACADDTSNAVHIANPATATDALDALDAINGAFHEAYLQDMKESLAKTSPIILVEGNKLILLKSGKREEYEFIPAMWNTLKAVDHGPLGLFVLLNLHTDTTLDTATIEKVKTFQQLFKNAKASLSKYGLSQDEVIRQGKIVDQSLAFIQTVLANRTVSASQLQSFTRGITPPLMDNVDDDIEMELSRVDKQIQKWKEQMTDSQWQSLYVIIQSGHMPRQQETLSQYFALLLNEPDEGHRWIYAENVASEKEALDLLAKHIVDATIAINFFNDPMRMHRDLLGDAAKKYLAAHPPLQKSH